jgi:hypothetical protein
MTTKTTDDGTTSIPAFLPFAYMNEDKHNYNATRPTMLSTRLNNHDFDATRYDELNMMLTLLGELLNWVVELHLHPAPHLAHHQPSHPLYMWTHLPRCESRQQHFKLQQL